jgi:MoaA/NifB/PqqE/SkfB family radical SAM enzyme
MNDLHGRFCLDPFYFLLVGNRGKVYPCCAGWVNDFSIGDIFKSSDINAIWNSEQAKLFRQSVCDGSFRYCNGIICPKIASGSLPRIDQCDAALREIISNPMQDLKYPPKKIQFSYDTNCNLKCISCRHTSYSIRQTQLKLYDNAKETILKPMLKDAEVLVISGSGELFFSKHSLKYLEELNPEEYPKLRLNIMTNGTLFTEENWNRYPLLREKINLLIISIDASKKETYETIRRGGKWEVLLSNLSFASQLRKSNRIKGLHLMFVVQRLNYRDMVGFIQFGYELSADRICFSRIANWGIYTDEEFIHLDVCDPRNDEHQKFIEVLQHPFFAAKRVSLENIGQFRKTV